MEKQTNDSCEAYKKAGRKELLDNEMSEIAIINEFLPVSFFTNSISFELFTKEIAKYFNPCFFASLIE